MTFTCATPLIIEIRCATIVSAYSFTSESFRTGEYSARFMIGWSAGFTFCSVGGKGMLAGSRRTTAAIAACTSCAAASSGRSSANCRVMLQLPRTLVDVIESMPGMVVNCRSSGVATDAPIVSGLAPGSWAFT
jgi:hypothetical protein